MAERPYEQCTLTERAERHIYSAREMLGAAQQNMQAAGNQLPGPQATQLNILAAQAYWTAAQAEAALANTCALLALTEGSTAGAPLAKLETR